MAFTDDQLESLKTRYFDDRNGVILDIGELDALLARLQAAEAWADTQMSLLACTQEDFDSSDGDAYVLQDIVKEKLEAWRKAAGK